MCDFPAGIEFQPFEFQSLFDSAGWVAGRASTIDPVNSQVFFISWNRQPLSSAKTHGDSIGNATENASVFSPASIRRLLPAEHAASKTLLQKCSSSFTGADLCNVTVVYSSLSIIMIIAYHSYQQHHTCIYAGSAHQSVCLRLELKVEN